MPAATPLFLPRSANLRRRLSHGHAILSPCARVLHPNADRRSSQLTWSNPGLGARDFASLRDFYQRVGWPQVMDDGEFTVFELRGIVLALFPLARLAHDGNTDAASCTGGIHSTIGLQVGGPAEVDRLTEHMRAAGRTGDQGTRRRGVLHRAIGVPVRPRGQLLRDRLGRHARQPRRPRIPQGRRPVARGSSDSHCSPILAGSHGLRDEEEHERGASSRPGNEMYMRWRRGSSS